jgi:hypothetical protein
VTPAFLSLLALVAFGALMQVARTGAGGPRLARTLGGAALAGAALMLLARQVGLAMALAMAGVALLGRARGVKTPKRGKVSTVRTRLVEMRLDHDTGAMDGRVLVGDYRGRALSSIQLAELLSLVAALDPAEEETRSLLETYLDRAHPDWRASAPEPPPAAGGAMTREEAFRILGLEPGAGAEAIHEAHKRLMKRVHPDLGGSAALAAQINAAKDLLTG